VRIDFGSSCCSANRPAIITVRVGNNRPDLGINPVCNKFTGFIEEGRPLFLPCARPMPGAFVSITLESPGNPLSICEVFVYTDHGNYISQLLDALPIFPLILNCNIYFLFFRQLYQ
jgi:hypothetical protein